MGLIGLISLRVQLSVRGNELSVWWVEPRADQLGMHGSNVVWPTSGEAACPYNRLCKYSCSTAQCFLCSTHAL